MALETNSLAVCIPTFRRPHLLRRLLADLDGQTISPERLIVVDGDPVSGAVLQMLQAAAPAGETLYVPSNHANLPYQRYLGWKAASGCRRLLYLDDDLRILSPTSVESVLAPLAWAERTIAGVTAEITMPDHGGPADALSDRRAALRRRKTWLVARFGSAAHLSPGDLTPSGDRCPVPHRGRDYETVSWLRGGVMAFRASALTEDCFAASLFALAEMGCGLGEDTFLSRRAACRGELLVAFQARFAHPHDDQPQAYSTEPFRLGHATAYSRRFLNDHYRGFDPPRAADRIALAESYIGNLLLHVSRSVRSPRAYRWRFTLGYAVGVLRGVFQKPIAARLTPGVDWKADAEKALSRIVALRPATLSC